MGDGKAQARAYGFPVHRTTDGGGQVTGVVLLDDARAVAVGTFNSWREAKGRLGFTAGGETAEAMRARYASARGRPVVMRWVGYPMEDQDVRALIWKRVAAGEECWGLAFDGAAVLDIAGAVVAEQLGQEAGNARPARTRFSPLMLKVEDHLRDAQAVYAGADAIDHPNAGSTPVLVGEALATIRKHGIGIIEEMEHVLAAATAAMMVAMLNEQGAWSDDLFLEAVDGALLARLEQIKERTS